MFKRNYILFILILISSCSTVSRKIVYENYNFKNLANDNKKMAKDLIKKYNYEKALYYLNESLKYNILADNFEGIIKDYIDIGTSYLFLKEKEKALQYYENAITIFYNEEKKEKYEYLEAYIYESLGVGYYFLQDYVKAKDFFNKALLIEKKLNNIENIAVIYINLGKIEKSNNNISSSLEYFSNSQLILEKLYKEKKINNINNLSNVYYSLALLYSKNSKLDEAKDYLFKALEIDKMIENSIGIADDYYGLGMVFEKENNASKSMLYFKKSREIYKLMDNISQYKEITKKLIEIQYKLALYRDYIDSIKEIVLLSKDSERDYYIKVLVDSTKDENVKSILKENEIKEFLNKIKL